MGTMIRGEISRLPAPTKANRVGWGTTRKCMGEQRQPERTTTWKLCAQQPPPPPSPKRGQEMGRRQASQPRHGETGLQRWLLCSFFFFFFQNAVEARPRSYSKRALRWSKKNPGRVVQVSQAQLSGVGIQKRFRGVPQRAQPVFSGPKSSIPKLQALRARPPRASREAWVFFSSSSSLSLSFLLSVFSSTQV